MKIITRMCQDGMVLPSPDFRRFGSFDWRPLPLGLTALNHNAEREVVGNLTALAKDADGVVWGLGDTAATREGVKYETLIRDGHVSTVSVDAGGFHATELLVDPDTGEELEIGSGPNQAWDDIDEWIAAHPGYIWTVRFDDYTIGELSLTTISGWPDARIWPADHPDAPAFPEGDSVLQAASAPAVREFPAAWFDRQPLDDVTPYRITPEGQQLGHIYVWGTCHRSVVGECVTVPRDVTLADFHGGSTAFDDGTVARTGLLTFLGLHTPVDEPMTRDELRAAIEDTGTQIGPVRVYKDEFGIQVAGGIHGDVDPDLAARAMAGTPSLDARERDGKPLALFGCHVVNCGGFPVLDESADGEGGLVRLDNDRLLVASSVPPAESDCGCQHDDGDDTTGDLGADVDMAGRVAALRVRAADQRATLLAGSKRPAQ